MALAIAGALLVAGCATTPRQALTPMQAVFAAANAAPHATSGVFEFKVRATGRDGDRLYLNSEADYRDQRNLSIAILPDAQGELEQRYGPLAKGLIGRTISVRGAARRVRINFTDGGAPTGKYYYQTHVVVGTPSQIEVLPTR
nr:hypothetical protein [Glacieibacterium frigidum]